MAGSQAVIAILAVALAAAAVVAGVALRQASRLRDQAGHAALLGAPVPENGTGMTAVPESGAAEPETADHEAYSPPDTHLPSSASSAPPISRPAHAEGPARTFDVAASRRGPVVFEEDDDLDVPDFLK